MTMENKRKIFLDLSEIQSDMFDSSAFRSYVNENELNLDFDVEYDELPVQTDSEVISKEPVSVIVISSAIATAIVLDAIRHFYKDTKEIKIKLLKIDKLKNIQTENVFKATRDSLESVDKSISEFNE